MSIGTTIAASIRHEPSAWADDYGILRHSSGVWVSAQERLIFIRVQSCLPLTWWEKVKIAAAVEVYHQTQKAELRKAVAEAWPNPAVLTKDGGRWAA